MDNGPTEVIRCKRYNNERHPDICIKCPEKLTCKDCLGRCHHCDMWYDCKNKD